MNDQTLDNDLDFDPEDEASQAPLDELTMLKERAKTLGIPIAGNVGLDTLRKRIHDHLNGIAPEPEEEPEVPAVAPTMGQPVVPPRPMTKAEREQKIRQDLVKEKMKLVRCRIYNLNPAKRDLNGEIITVGNKFLGTVRKFIPFGEATDGGYHIEKVIYDDLMSRKFQQIRVKKRPGKPDEIDSRMVPEYSIEILPQLTRAELRELATKQAAAERMGAE